MEDDDDIVLVDELRAARERLRETVRVDDHIIDLITWAAERIEELEAKLNGS